MEYFNIQLKIKDMISSNTYKLINKKSIFECDKTSQKDYFDLLESEYEEFRAFKHDYNNILTTISGYIEDKDMDSLSKYFYDKIINLKDFDNLKLFKVGALSKLKIPEIRGIILTKIIEAERKKIRVHIEISEEISEMNNIDKILVARCLAIIIDNAIEAAEGCEDALINIIFINENNSIRCIVENSHKEINIDLKKIYEKGVSSKGIGRGIGLNIVKNLLVNEDNILLNSIVKNDRFIQEMYINTYYQRRKFNVKSIFV